MEYGLIASRSFAIVADLYWQLGAVWDSTPLWVVVVIGLAIAAGSICFSGSGEGAKGAGGLCS